ncbi:MAG: (2Fe-2S)-binding protein [Alphaproteobacteria bacterium]|nr:(2Fe-2S)-binding protein [Alphaproteobacteria bacterium]
MRFEVNGESVELEVSPDTPLLWVLRDHLGLTGTKFGCGVGQCGACTVHLNGRATRSCLMPAAALEGATVRTIEDLAPHPLVDAWVAAGVPQCGYCQSGQLMAAAALLEANARPTRADIEQWMTNLCRCGTYDRIRGAIADAALKLPEPPPPEEAPPEAPTDAVNDAEGGE